MWPEIFPLVANVASLDIRDTKTHIFTIGSGRFPSRIHAQRLASSSPPPMAACSEPKWLHQGPYYGSGRVSGPLIWMSASRIASTSRPDSLSTSLPSRASACWAERDYPCASHLLVQDHCSSVLRSSARHMVQSVVDDARFVHGCSCLKMTLAACCTRRPLAAQWSGEGQGVHRDEGCSAHGAAIGAVLQPTACHMCALGAGGRRQERHMCVCRKNLGRERRFI